MTICDVDTDILRRHLGLPPGVQPDEAVCQRMDQARQWYQRHGDPWTATSVRDINSMTDRCVTLMGGIELNSETLAHGLTIKSAGSLAVVAVTAGRVVDDEVDRRWQDDRPDEAMFLAAYAGAAVEQLREQEIAQLQETVGREGKFVLPYFSPGYDGWDLSDQHALFAALDDHGPLQILPSCFLRPTRSTLAAVGITDDPYDGQPSFQYFQRSSDTERGGSTTEYAFPQKTLAKWSRERLNIQQTDSGYHLQFRFDGTTCSSMGMPLSMAYNVELETETDGRLRIAGSSCQSWQEDTGHRGMCAFRSDSQAFIGAIADDQPLLGKTLDEIRAWQPDVSPAGCLCLKSNRDHKWRMVLQTIHFALNNGRVLATDWHG